MIITKVSQLTGITHSMDLNVTEEQMYVYEMGWGLLQNVFPDLPKEQREFIKTGITPEEWSLYFGELEEV